MNQVPVAVTSIEDLVDRLELAKLHTYELVATARDEHEEVDSGADSVEAGKERISVRTGIRIRERGLDFRVEFSVNHMLGMLVADIGAFYESETPLELVAGSEEIIIDFGDRVAMMALFPYLRQSISDLGHRVLVDYTLPMLRPGQLSFAPESAEGGEDLA